MYNETGQTVNKGSRSSQCSLRRPSIHLAQTETKPNIPKIVTTASTGSITKLENDILT